MLNERRYLSAPTKQEKLLDENGVHVGYRIAYGLQKGEVTHTERVEVITGQEEAERLASSGSDYFTQWYVAQVDQHGLIAKANAALDAID